MSAGRAEAAKSEKRSFSGFVHGIPQKQGSGTPRHNPKTGQTWYDSMPTSVRDWRVAVKSYLAINWDAGRPLDGPIAASFIFVFPRVKSAPKRVFHTVAPDEDKLLRAMLDALVKGAAITDDARVFAPTPIGIYGDEPGVHILLREVEETAEALFAFRMESAQREFDLLSSPNERKGP